ncbi:hypothetical protein, partial [uncultured Allobaculum sp.]
MKNEMDPSSRMENDILPKAADSSSSMTKPGILRGASPDPALQFVFAMFATLTWLSKIVTITPDARLVMGVLQLSLGVAAFTGSRMNLL